MSNTIYNKVTIDGTTYIDLSQDTVSDASHIRQGYIGHLNDGTTVTGTYAGSGEDIPVFTFNFDSNYEVVSATCNKTWTECEAAYNNADGRACSIFSVEGSSYIDKIVVNVGEVYTIGTDNIITYIGHYGAVPGFDILYHENGQIEYVTPSTYTSTLNATSNGTYTPPNYGVFESVIVNVPSSAPNLQAKTNINPTESSQTIQADSGYDGLSSVQINAISSTYVGSGITQRSSSNLTASGATVTVPAGYYSAQATKSVASMTLPIYASTSATSGYTSQATIGRTTSDLYINIPAGYNSAGAYYTISATPNGSAATPATTITANPTISISSSGLITASVSGSQNITPTVSAGYISSGTAGTVSVSGSKTQQLTTKAAATITPSTSNQTIASGTYLTGTQTIVGDANLVGSNIISGKSIFGVAGTVAFQTYYTGSSTPASSLGSNGDIYLMT